MADGKTTNFHKFVVVIVLSSLFLLLYFKWEIYLEFVVPHSVSKRQLNLLF